METTLHYTTHYRAIQYSTIQYNTVQYSTIQYNTVQYSTTQYNTVQYSTIQYNTVQHSTIPYSQVFYWNLLYSPSYLVPEKTPLSVPPPGRREDPRKWQAPSPRGNHPETQTTSRSDSCRSLPPSVRRADCTRSSSAYCSRQLQHISPASWAQIFLAVLRDWTIWLLFYSSLLS